MSETPITTEQHLEDALERLASSRANMLKVSAEAAKEAAAQKKRLEERNEPFRLVEKALLIVIQPYVDLHRKTLPKDGDGEYPKTITFKGGVVKWRRRGPSVKITKNEKVIDFIKANLKKFGGFLRTVEEINKEAMKANPELAEEVEGVKVASAGVDFTVESPGIPLKK